MLHVINPTLQADLFPKMIKDHQNIVHLLLLAFENLSKVRENFDVINIIPANRCLYVSDNLFSR